MYKSLILAAILCTAGISTARAQVDLSTYADGNGLINVQKLTCAQLAGTWQGDADMLTTWYSGTWTCRKALPGHQERQEGGARGDRLLQGQSDQLIIEAIAVVFKDMRARLEIEMKP
jgi:hypothetical protein